LGDPIKLMGPPLNSLSHLRAAIVSHRAAALASDLAEKDTEPPLLGRCSVVSPSSATCCRG
jgi:hypothetical protein